MQQPVVDTRADPGVRCGVELLLVGELCGFPVAQALGFGYPLAEYDRRKFAQAFLFDAPLSGELLKIHEARFLKVPDVVQCPQVALYIGADFQDLLVFEDFDDGFVERNLAEPEQEALFRRGELQQCDPIDDARPERRPGFGVEPDDGLCRQVAAGLPEPRFRVHDDDRAPEFDGRKQSGLLVADAILKCDRFVHEIAQSYRLIVTFPSGSMEILPSPLNLRRSSAICAGSDRSAATISRGSRASLRSSSRTVFFEASAFLIETEVFNK